MLLPTVGASPVFLLPPQVGLLVMDELYAPANPRLGPLVTVIIYILGIINFSLKRGGCEEPQPTVSAVRGMMSKKARGTILSRSVLPP